ncbi:cupin-like domain-containing protein [Asticcacaulis endophyticus]|uniref:cupin-like domain-containing protein n=1 Tax=Asticcacaulis endophyticus TaxID=1395890 RepID=UPI0016761721|nr:cupin-like domain-containing protein [Asticcacaulis endophyticus]
MSILSVPVVNHIDRHTFDNDIRFSGQPVIFKNIAEHWPAVQAAKTSPDALCSYLKRHDNGKPVGVAVCDADLKGQFFYNDALTGLNYKTFSQTLSYLADWCIANRYDANPQAVYLQAQSVDLIAPGMSPALPLGLLDASVRPRLWVGNTLRTQTHFDYAANIAVHVSGKKTFTLFAPDQTGNLYPGPLDRTPAGVPISMASLEAPDFDTFPRLRDALDNAYVAELEPGDGLFIPPLWWHHVQTTGPLNMLVNYWWNEAAANLFNPMKALEIAGLAYRHLPPTERAAWRELLEFFVFEDKGDPIAHLPDHVDSVFRSGLSSAQIDQHKSRLSR